MNWFRCGFVMLIVILSVVGLGSTGSGTKREPAGTSAARTGMTYLGVNSKGYKEYRSEKDGSVMVFIPAGELWMGSDEGEGDSDEHPKHKVHLDSYYMDKYEVTNAQYRRFCDATGREYPEDPGWSGMNNYFVDYPGYPVVCVSWEDAIAYATWADKRLPPEAEWEKAARGRGGLKYPWGSEEPDAGGHYRCNLEGNGDGYDFTSPVGTYEGGVSPYGLHDMAGNVWEWCSDWYDNAYYERSAPTNPKGPDIGPWYDRVLRGGAWGSVQDYARCAYRGYDYPYFRLSYIGFRCARTIE